MSEVFIHNPSDWPEYVIVVKAIWQIIAHGAGSAFSKHYL